MGRRCPRTFTVLADGGVRCTWACGARQDFLTETAVDLAVLEDHIGQYHHHRPHLRHHKEN